MAVDAALVTGLSQVLSEYLAARSGPMQGHPVASLLTSGLPKAFPSTYQDGYHIKGSAGQFGNWARCPWVALFDPRVTRGASHGFYVVFLFRTTPGRETTHLSPNQATTEAREIAGTTAGAEKMLLNNARQYANAYEEQLPPGAHTGPIDLDTEGNDFARGYELGNIASYEFTGPWLDTASDAEVLAPLDRLLDVYREMSEDYLRDGEIGRGRRREGSAKPESRRGAASKPKTRMPLADIKTKSWTSERPQGAREAEPREARLLADLAARLERYGLLVERGRYLTDNGDVLYSDAVVDQLSAIFEAKASTSREAVRMAIGQLIDYGRFEEDAIGVVVLEGPPESDDLRQLVEEAGFSLMFPVGSGWRAFGPIREAMKGYATARSVGS